MPAMVRKALEAALEAALKAVVAALVRRNTGEK
jgi:hypothetical protein